MGQRRVTVRDAAAYLGISEGAVRSRLSRGTLEGVKVGGVTYVVLDTGIDDMSSTDAVTDYRDELIEELRDRVRSLEEANRENRRIIMQQAQNLAAIEAPPQTPQEATQAAESASEGESREEAQQTRTEPQSAGEQQRVSWWRRLFGRE